MTQVATRYLSALTIRPTAPLTFRIFPGSMIRIATYPFVPPSTLSGFLKRIWLARGLQAVPPMEPRSAIRKRKVDSHPMLVLPRSLICLGATAEQYQIHRAYRQGPKSLSHSRFSMLRRTEDKENFQLMAWEYLMADQLTGYVVSQDAALLDKLTELRGYGWKLGKEGYAVVEDVTSPHPLQEERVVRRASIFAPAAAMTTAAPPYDLYRMYRIEWRDDDPALDENRPAMVKGFRDMSVAVISRETELDYLISGDRAIPRALVEELK